VVDAGVTVRVLIESTGNITVAYASTPMGVSTQQAFTWIGQPPLIALQVGQDSTPQGFSSVGDSSGLLAPFVSVTFTPTRPQPCSPSCTGALVCNRLTSTCECPAATVPPNCEPCPAYHVYSPGLTRAQDKCAPCPACQNGGVCVSGSTPGTARCSCPEGAAGYLCDLVCPLGKVATSACDSTCATGHDCVCGLCYCNATLHPGKCSSPASEFTDSYVLIVGIVGALAGVAILACIAVNCVVRCHCVTRVREAFNTREPDVGALPPPQNPLDPPEPGSLAYEVGNTSPLLLAHLVARHDPLMSERAGQLHDAVTNPLLIAPRRMGLRLSTAAEEDAQELEEFAGL
jgi:hypothetical protein